MRRATKHKPCDKADTLLNFGLEKRRDQIRCHIEITSIDENQSGLCFLPTEINFGLNLIANFVHVGKSSLQIAISFLDFSEN